MQKIISFKNKNKKFKIKTKVCNSVEKITGLTFTSRENAQALLFEFHDKCPPIHSWFVFFPFLAIWLDDKNKIVDVKKIKPFQSYVKPKKPFSKLIEIPINNKYKELISSFGSNNFVS